MSIPVSVLVPTRNEEKNIRKCLESLRWADEIYVVDSKSRDRTAMIARQMGAKVVEFAWDGRGPRKKSWAMSNILWRNDWLLIVDADEEVTLELQEAIADAVTSDDTAAYLIPYKYFFMGRLLRHGAPLWKLILLQHKHARFERLDVPEVTGYDVELHEHPLVDGRVGRLQSSMIHHDFEGLFHHFERHNIYSDWEALLRTRYRKRDRDGEITARLFGSAMERRRFAKQLFLRSPGKPLIFFLYSYIIRAGFLDGRAGLSYNLLKAIYWYQVSLKERELRSRYEQRRSPVEMARI